MQRVGQIEKLRRDLAKALVHTWRDLEDFYWSDTYEV
jgi:hypothetical protein